MRKQGECFSLILYGITEVVRCSGVYYSTEVFGVHYLGGMKGDEESLFLFGPSTRTTGDNDQNIIIIFH